MATIPGIKEYLATPEARRTLLAVASLSIILGIIVYRLFLHPLRHIPGPFVARWCGLWRTYRYFCGTWHGDVLNLHKKYGRVVRIAPNEVSVVDGNAVKQLYGHGHSAMKTRWYSTWEVPNSAPGFFATQDQKLHAFLRRRVSSAYSMTAILKMEKYIQSCMSLMIQKLKIHAEKGDVVDMAEWTNAVAYDIVGELAYGDKLGHLETETDVMGTRKAVYNGFFMMANMGHFPGQMVLFRRVLEFLRLPNPFQSFQDWSIEKVSSRMNGKEKAGRDDMLSHFIKMKDVNGNPASHGEVLIEAMNIIGAGADTTSIGMRTCLYYICRNPEVYGRLRKDIDEYYNSRQLTEPISYNQTQEIPYLCAVVKEATRLIPSIVYQLLRYVPAGGMTIDGRYLPAGTEVGVSPIAQNRDRAVWGEDADTFRPERWLDNEVKARYFDSVNMTFGGNGPRTCIGRNLALVEMHKFVAQMLRTFDISLVDERNPWRITTYWFAYQHDMMVNLKIRRHVGFKCWAETGEGRD